MNLEQSLVKIVEHAHEELHIVRKRPNRKPPRATTARITTKLKSPPIGWTTTRTWFVGYMMLNTKVAGGTRV